MNKILLFLSVLALTTGCAASTHPSAKAPLGQPSSGDQLLVAARTPGPVSLEAVTAAHWEVPREGLINLEHPRAVAAGLEDGDEPILIQFFVLRHPQRGTYLVDSGVASSFRSRDSAPVSWLLKSAMNFEALDIQVDTKQWLASVGGNLDGVFLTHLHLDHIMGMPDIPAHVPVFTGPGETEASQLLHAATQGSTDGILAHSGPLNEWSFERDPSHRFAGVIDVFGDQSVFALHVPGHTPGSTAFLVRTPSGPQLIAGDVSHTRWGWEHSVEPGTFNLDPGRSVTSFHKLKLLARDLPGLVVHLGHQHIDE